MATLKTAQVPLPQLTLAQWRTSMSVWSGVDYTNGLDTDMQTEFDRLLNESHEYASQRAAHQPWGVEETTLTITAGADTLYAMPAAFRHVIVIVEEETDGTKTRTRQSTKLDYMNAEKGTTQHGWETDSVATWFFDGFTEAEPPVQQWRRIGTDKTGATARVQFRPYFGLLVTSGQDSYTVLPASEVPVIREHFRYQWALLRKNFEHAGVYRQAREDSIAAVEIGDRDTIEDVQMQGLDGDFTRQMS